MHENKILRRVSDLWANGRILLSLPLLL